MGIKQFITVALGDAKAEQILNINHIVSIKKLGNNTIQILLINNEKINIKDIEWSNVKSLFGIDN